MRKLGKIWLWLVYAFLYFPIFVVIIYSFNDTKYSTVWKGFTLKWYELLAKNHALIESVWHSLTVAIISATLATLLGTLIAICIKRYRFPGRKVINATLYVLTVSPEIVMGISLLILFVFCQIPLGFLSLLIAHTTLELPFATLMVLSRLSEFDESLIEAARDLGASEWQAIRIVMLPLIWTSMAAGWLLSFTLSMDDVLISFFVTGATYEILPLRIYSMVRLGVKPDINALSAIMFGITVLLLCIGVVLNKKSKTK